MLATENILSSHEKCIILKWALQAQHTHTVPPTLDPSHISVLEKSELCCMSERDSTDGSYTTYPRKKLSTDFCVKLQNLSLLGFY